MSAENFIWVNNLLLGSVEMNFKKANSILISNGKIWKIYLETIVKTGNIIRLFLKFHVKLKFYRNIRKRKFYYFFWFQAAFVPEQCYGSQYRQIF